MARLKAVRIGRTINKGNFESLRVDVELEPVDDNEPFDRLVRDANALIDKVARGGELTSQERGRVVDRRILVSNYYVEVPYDSEDM